MSLFRRLFPESLFPRKLSDGAERRLRLAQARAEETVLRAHVQSALTFVDTLADEIPFDRAIDSYIRVMGVPEPLATMVVTRVMVQLGRELLPPPRVAELGSADARPRLRLAEPSTPDARGNRTG
ncbi:MAG: hypothetical protein K2X99_07220 [Gemmatimonadaceae bacterium]|nr:hypothetical protein [Gemmatimonadaceae bacterium]